MRKGFRHRIGLRHLTARLLCWLASGWLVVNSPSLVWGQAADVRLAPEVSFDQLDGDSNRQLSLVEFQKFPGPAAILQRDFALFDFDQNQTLSRWEFSAASGSLQQTPRGPIPDPFTVLAEVAHDSLDQAYG
ncbi:MAG: hypothetical protein MI861_23610, partial [Pirellulales bacterium]|nr:hypothetical protein [Pirellulales bacterium]